MRRFLIDQRTKNENYLRSKRVVWFVGTQLMLASWMIVWGLSRVVGPHIRAARILGFGVSLIGTGFVMVLITVLIGRHQLMRGRADE